VDANVVEKVGALPQTRGMEHLLYHLEGSGNARLELRLTDPAAADVFVTLVEDLTTSVAAMRDDASAASAWIGRLARWQRLLQRTSPGLSPDQQRGLYAELWLIRELLAESIGIIEAVDAWMGPAGASHDFQLSTGSIEVKSTATNQPQVVRISSERQLDETGTPSLHLLHVSLDVHQHSGETLIAMVGSIRSGVSGGAAQAEFEERLLAYGYVDVHEPLYAATGYTLREHGFYRVSAGFPRIVESDLPDGVGGVQYRLAVAACASFAVETEATLSLLSGAGS
jgi:hypothetical protein